MAGMYGCFKSQGSDSAAMASGSPDLKTNQEPGEVREESSGKKKSKFQTFKKFFARKKRKQPSSGGAEVGLKASQSIDNVSKTLENNALTRSEKDKGSGSKITLGGKAMSHDSVFVSDSSEANEALGASQDSIHGKVKSLQLQLKQAIRLGSPPSLMCVKKSEDAATMSEDDGLPCSPPEYAPFHSHQDQRNSSNSLHGLDSDNDQLSCGASSRAVSPLVVPADFSQPASPFACLDNSAAKHKLGLRHKAHDRRKPARFVQRLDGKTEADSAVEENLVISTPGAETNAKEEEEEEEEEEERNTEDVSDDQLKPKVERETEEEEERHQLEDPRLSLLRGEEGEDESEAEADVSHGPDTSCEEEQSASEEETSDGPPVPSSESTLPLDPPRVTPEPPAGSREHVTPNTSSTEEDSQAESGSTSGEEAAFQQEEDGESSLLEEVLSSLKTPLNSCSLEGEDAEEETEENQKEVEEKEEDHVEIQSTFPCSFLSDQIAEDPKDSWQEEDNSVEVEEDNSVEVEEDNSVEVEEEEESRKEEEESRKEEEESRKEEEESRKEEEEPVKEEEEPVKGENHLVMENFNNHHEEETKKKEEEEDQNTPTSLNEEEEEEEFINLEKEDEDEKGEAQQQEEEEESEAEKMPEMIPCTHDKEDQRGSLLEEADEVTNAADEKIHLMRDEEDDFNPNSEHVEEDEENEEADFEGEQPEKEEEATVEEVEHESDDLKQSEDNGLPEPLCTKSPQESVISSSSKTSIININLVSPSSEKSFQFSPAAVSPDHSVTESPTAEDEEEADPAEEEAKEDEKSPPEQQDSPPVTPSPEETKVRFTIAPAWQRSQSLSSPSSSPVCISSPREEEVTAKDCTADAEPAGEAVFGPGKVKAAGSPTFKSQSSPSSVKASSPVAANTAESAATTGGNPDNPFGVRLRKTSALLRFNSEEETLEAPVESVNPSTSCKGESPQVCSKPSICQPVCNKPALPKKPEVHVEAGGKLKRFSDPPRADPPSWISVAKQKQKIYKGNVLDEMTLKKEEQEKKSSLPSKEPRSKAAESSSHAVKPENIKPSVSPEKDPKRVLSPQTPAPSQPFKSQLPPCPVAPKPQVLPPLAKHSQPSPPQKSLPPPTPVPVHSKRPSTPPSKPTSNLQTAPVPSPSFVSITTPEKSPSRSAGPPGQRGLPTPALPQDEPPWMALAKKKAKAWSEMPQIVQ